MTRIRTRKNKVAQHELTLIFEANISTNCHSSKYYTKQTLQQAWHEMSPEKSLVAMWQMWKMHLKLLSVFINAFLNCYCKINWIINVGTAHYKPLYFEINYYFMIKIALALAWSSWYELWLVLWKYLHKFLHQCYVGFR